MATDQTISSIPGTGTYRIGSNRPTMYRLICRIDGTASLPTLQGWYEWTEPDKEGTASYDGVTYHGEWRDIPTVYE